MVTVYAGGMMLRPVTEADKPALLVVESKSTPNLSYLPAVYGMFLADAPRGEFMLVEEDGAVLGCAKYTLLPDGSAWLETLRVVPEAQGRGLGKRMYERFFELAREQGVPTMRMYTGVDNVVSKGLAEHFGFTLEETFHGFSRPVGPVRKAPAFQAVSDPVQATGLLMPLRPAWGDFLVMNRTFYPFMPDVCAHLARRGMVYSDGPNVLVAGARFSPEEALHLALFAGDAAACLSFAERVAQQRSSRRLLCLFPTSRAETETALEHAGFMPDRGEYIVMKVDVQQA